MNVNIYSLSVPDTLEVKYIGRTKNSLKKRLSGHLAAAKKKVSKTRKDYWLLNLLKENKKPIISLLTTVEGWEESYIYEQNLIKEYLDNGYDLYNLKDLGVGHTLPCREDVKLKISETVKRLHREGLYNDTIYKVPITIYDLDGNNIQTFKSITDCAKFLNISLKHLEKSLQRGDKRLHSFQIRKQNLPKIDKYIKSKIIRECKSNSILDTVTNEILKFHSIKETLIFLDIGMSWFSKCRKNKLLIKNRYIVT